MDNSNNNSMAPEANQHWTIRAINKIYSRLMIACWKFNIFTRQRTGMTPILGMQFVTDEILWANVREGNVVGVEELLKYFYSDSSNRNLSSVVEDAINIAVDQRDRPMIELLIPAWIDLRRPMGGYSKDDFLRNYSAQRVLKKELERFKAFNEIFSEVPDLVHALSNGQYLELAVFTESDEFLSYLLSKLSVTED